MCPRKKDLAVAVVASTQSQRRALDQTAALGCATTRLEERLMASVGVLAEAAPQFEPAPDVP